MCTLILLISVIGVVQSLDNGVGRTPAMGYNSWNDFRCDNITAANIRAVTDKFAELKLNEFGYEYINIDDCWSVRGQRDDNGRIIPNPDRFPDGMKALVDYIHSKGFKFGIYTDRGGSTCAGYPASLHHETVDAQTFADWGVDYLKEDSCHASSNQTIAFEQYGTMRDALNATGRPIYFSLCGWRAWYAKGPGSKYGNSWRIFEDVNGYNSIYANIRVNQNLAEWAGPGGWNDPDMLVGSSPGSAVYNTPDQARMQFSMWAMMAAPLLLGGNVLNMTDWDLETYTNREIIAIDQDPLGIQGAPLLDACPPFRYNAEGTGWLEEDKLEGPDGHQIWVKPLHDGSMAVAFVNFGAKPVNITCDENCFRDQLKIPAADVRDLWEHKDLGRMQSLTVSLGVNGTSKVFKLSTPGPRNPAAN